MHKDKMGNYYLLSSSGIQGQHVVVSSPAVNSTAAELSTETEYHAYDIMLQQSSRLCIAHSSCDLK